MALQIAGFFIGKEGDFMFSDYPDVLKVDVVSELLSISRKRVYFLIDNGLLQAIKPGKAYLIPKACLLEYISRELPSA